MGLWMFTAKDGFNLASDDLQQKPREPHGDYLKRLGFQDEGAVTFGYYIDCCFSFYHPKDDSSDQMLVQVNGEAFIRYNQILLPSFADVMVFQKDYLPIVKNYYQTTAYKQIFRRSHDSDPFDLRDEIADIVRNVLKELDE